MSDDKPRSPASSGGSASIHRTPPMPPVIHTVTLGAHPCTSCQAAATWAAAQPKSCAAPSAAPRMQKRNALPSLAFACRKPAVCCSSVADVAIIDVCFGGSDRVMSFLSPCRVTLTGFPRPAGSYIMAGVPGHVDTCNRCEYPAIKRQSIIQYY